MEHDIIRSELTIQAEQLARKAHAGQVDKLGVDYIEHVSAVANSVRHLGETHEIVALLHDTIEDCPDRNVVSFSIIEDLFGDDVRDAVDCMTKRDGESYENYLQRIASNPVARSVKLADLTHNQSRLHFLKSTEKSRLEIKYGAAQKFLSSQCD